MVHTSLYAMYAGAAALAATTGDALTHATGAAVAAYLVARLVRHRARAPRPAAVATPAATTPAA